MNIIDLLLHVVLGYLPDGSTEISSTWTKVNKCPFSNFLCTTSPELHGDLLSRTRIKL